MRKGECVKGKEGERSLASASELNLYLPVPSGEVRRLESGSLSLMLAQVVKDLDSLHFLRSPDDLPEAIRYLRNPENEILVMVSRRRPTVYIGKGVPSAEGHRFGYFAEAYEEVNGIPQNKITNPSTILSGNYEPVDISDQGDYRDAGLTPTNFTDTRRTMFEVHRERNVALPEGSRRIKLTEDDQTEIIERQGIGETGALAVPEEPVIAKLFEVANTQADQMERVGEAIKFSIRDRFIASTQGLSPEVGLGHLIITDEGDSSPLIPLSKKLGLESQTIPFWQMTHELSPYIRHVIRRGGKASEVFPLARIEDIDNYQQDSLGLFRTQAGIFPMVVTLDTRGLSSAVHQRDYSGAKDKILYNLVQDSLKYPLFSIIEIGEDLEEDETLIKRQGSGRYLLKGENIEDMQELLVKIGVDYALTKQVRGLSSLVSSL